MLPTCGESLLIGVQSGNVSRVSDAVLCCAAWPAGMMLAPGNVPGSMQLVPQGPGGHHPGMMMAAQMGPAQGEGDVVC
jgi:hypothetical protein